MNGEAESTTASAREVPSDQKPGCPGLSTRARWDEAEYLRGELYTEDHLVAHATELAHCHGEPRSALTPGPLRARFAAARQRIRAAYQILSAEARHRREPTPAEEWLLDNANVVEDQLREIAEDLPLGYLLELPRLGRGEMRGHPRVYALCIDYLRHTDSRVDLHSLANFVNAYQGVSPLTIGELWAVPIMLRLGLSLGVGALAASEAAAQDRASGDIWAERLLQAGATPAETGARLRELEQSRQPVSAAFLVQLLHRLREHDAPPERAREWVAERCAALGTTPDELARREHLRQAADQVSVGNAITSMRAVSAFDWDSFFERTSQVEAVLRRDPAHSYAESDKATRDRYRHAVEALARRGKRDEVAVAQQALELCTQAAADAAGGSQQPVSQQPVSQQAVSQQPMSQQPVSVRSHVGYYLVDAGRSELERRVGYRPGLRNQIVRAVLAWPLFFYFGTLALFSLALLGGAAQSWLAALPFDARLPVFLALFALPASEIALALTSSLTVAICPPRVLPGLELKAGIPDQHRTLVAVPALIDSPATIEQLLEDLEVRSLANPDANLYYALLTDLTDADVETRDDDAALLELMLQGIRSLNARHAGPHPRYWLLHRRRIHNAHEGRFMGWERKRGKLEELNRLLLGDRGTSYSTITAPRELLDSIRHVITLDADTELPRDVGRKLVAKLAHPLNRPDVNAETQRLQRGHAIIQPRVGTLPLSSRKSRFAAIAAGSPGIDPYTTAVSDVYQDLFGEGSFVGKGIYDVAAFQQVMTGRTPENRLLSHDLFEGIFARAALATDVEVLDEQPSAYHVQVGRQHRWVRGDWQLLPWLLPRVPTVDGRRRNDLGWLDAWKIFDNLRRSLLAPGIVLLAVWSWFLQQRLAGAVAAALLGVFAVPMCARLLLDLVRESSQPSRSFFGSLGGDLKTNARQLVLNVVFTLDQAWVSLDAIARTFWRLARGRHLLEWTTMRQTAQTGAGERTQRRLWMGSVACVALGVGVGLHDLTVLPFAVPLLIFWAAAPLVAHWLSQPAPLLLAQAELSDSDRRLLRRTARKTWRFFDTFVSAEDHFLPPDNYQEDPRSELAHRTSPTNIGLYLLSVVSARELGFIGLRQAAERLRQTLGTIERLEKREGHLLNWYDTASLHPLEPRYVSTVDSGNLAAYLWTLREACEDMASAAFLSPVLLDAAADSLGLALEQVDEAPAPAASELRTLQRQIEALQTALRDGQTALPDALGEALHRVRECRAAPWSRSLGSDCAYWLEQAELGLDHAQRELGELAPVPSALAGSSPLRARPELAELAQQLWACAAQADSPRGVVAARRRALELAQSLDTALAQTSPSAELRSDCEREIDACLRALERKADACSELLRELAQLGEQAVAVADGMSFRFLFDEQRELFSIGYNVSSARLDGSHYDLLASEARLASLWCIAKGEVPERHWFRLGRPRTALPGGRALLSWSGSMFEYLMPLLLMRAHPQTLLAEGCATAVDQQRRYGAKHGVPWGVSESAYNVMDLRMTYQYRAFGVPGLGLKAGLGEDRVVAPYATLLAGLVRPDLVVRNLRALQQEGLDGPYGFYESIDYTPAHVPPGRRGVVVKAFMAHHQGMSLVALDSMLNGAPMQRRFHRHPRIKAAELLLEERVPVRSPLVNAPTPVLRPSDTGRDVDVVENLGREVVGPLRVHLLGHGELSSLVSATGAGVVSWKGLDINRFREDPLLDAGGIYLYVHNRTARRSWSTAYLPTRSEPDYYNVSFAIDRVEFHRRDGDVQTVTEIALSPEHAAEVRRVTFTNHGSETLELELTSYSEVVLAPRRADVQHQTFSNLFVHTEALPERNALLAERRPRGAGEAGVWMAQLLCGEGEDWGPLDFDTSRGTFLGRGRGLDAPLGMQAGHPLARQTGNVLDPALALRRGVRLAPGASTRVTLTTALASSREELLGLVETYTAHHSVTRALELGWAGVRVELRHLGITATEVHRFQRLLSAVVFPHPGLRVATPPPSSTQRGLSGLWAHGISGDLPIVLLRLDHADFSEICRDLMLAHEFWRLNGFLSDLVVINEEPTGYLQNTQDQLRDLARRNQIDQRGGVFLRRADQMNEEERELLSCAARVVLRASQGSLARQLRRATQPALERPLLRPSASARRPEARGSAPRRPELLLDNGVGGFDQGGREYVMVLEPGLTTPAPWCNVMANPGFGSLITEAGSSYTWVHNSQRYRLSPWSNDPVGDASGELFYIRDDETGVSWSPTPLPAGLPERVVVRHAPGYTQFELESDGLRQELTAFVSSSEALKYTRIRIENRGAAPRRLSLFGVVEWVLGGSREHSRSSVCSSWDAELGCAFAQNPLSPFPAQRAFFTATRMPRSFSADRAELFGTAGTRRAPRGLAFEQLSGAMGAGLDPCAALQVTLELAPGETAMVSFVLGHANSLEEARALASKVGPSAARAELTAQAQFERGQQSWQDLLGAVQVSTPDPSLDALLNHWLLYQTVSSRIWARTGFYQSSGAFGFRDQLQDVLATLHARPELAREHLLRCAARQFAEGDVQHWWHEETGEGLRTRCSDDMLWLPFAVAEYVRVTGDRAVLDESVPFLTERTLAAGEEDLFSSPSISESRASLYEHCTRALDVGATSGSHGLPTMRGGDWNDGMNRVGQHGQGESVWLAWFLARTLLDFAPLAQARNDRERAGWCQEQLGRLTRAVEKSGWDGAWYRRAYFDDGSPLGSSQNSECSIDAIAQSWAVIAGIGDRERAAQAVAASQARLIRARDRFMCLLDPPFAHHSPDPGYIQAYPPGIRENGGQYTHGVLWTLQALTQLREGDRVAKLLDLLNPVKHADTPEALQRYRVEPYVVAADIYGGSEHAGRGGWTWYTGSAGWMYRILLERVLGLRRQGRTLSLAPCVPSSWNGFELSYRYGAATYRISVDNTQHVSSGVAQLELDGRVLREGYIRLLDDGKEHTLQVTMGTSEMAPLSQRDPRFRAG